MNLLINLVKLLTLLLNAFEVYVNLELRQICYYLNLDEKHVRILLLLFFFAVNLYLFYQSIQFFNQDKLMHEVNTRLFDICREIEDSRSNGK